MRMSLAGLVVLALIAVASAPAHAATQCRTGPYPGDGEFYSLSVTHTDCKTGRSVINAYYRCRTKAGFAGRCVTKVKGYACRETRENSPISFDGHVTCVNGKKIVRHHYQQITGAD